MKCPKCQYDNPPDAVYCAKCGAPHGPQDETLVVKNLHPSASREKFKIGSLVAGRYELLECLGKGGMGEVYKARDVKLQRFVALKFLLPGLTADKEASRRFIQEAQTASVLDHQNICTVYEIDETEDGQMYIAMAYYEGETLKMKIGRGPLPAKDAIGIVIQVAQGLSKAHGRGIVHRDIKPANIIAADDQVMKIVDFGLAELFTEARKTQTAGIQGTVAYMSPEQARGEAADQRSDLWSLGVMFYELLTGDIPFGGETQQSVLYSILQRTPIPPMDLREDVPEEAERIILKCLRKSKDDRYQSADRLITDLVKLKESLESRKVEAGDHEPMKDRRETERRQATVLIGEIVGYAEMLKSLETEDAAGVINRCLAMFDSVMKKYGSRIDEITGGRFRAVFGAPQAIEDAPKKAVNAAIELRNKLEKFRQEESLRFPLEIVMGIDTGTVIVGAIGEGKELSVIGETVGRALQLKEIGTKGSIYVGPLTYKYTKNDFQYEPSKPVPQMKKEGPAAFYKLLSVQEKVYRVGSIPERMIDSEMVGREAELNRLRLHVLKAIAGEGSLVSVIGEAGIGKSRLIAELVKIEDMKKAVLLSGRALSIGANLSFHPIIDILKSWAGIKEEDPPSVYGRKLATLIESVYPEAVAEVFPFIATMMGIKLSGAPVDRVKGIEGEALEKLILKNFRELIVRAAALHPLIFILEDLHWADATSVKMIGSLYRLVESNPILFINVFRPGYERTSEHLLGTLRARYADFQTEIHLEPLDERQCEVLIENLLSAKTLPAHIRELLIRKAEGNPFFIEEVARSFIDYGIVKVEDGRFQATEKIHSVVIPETINDVIMVRVDKLDGQTKALLKVASVVGRNFFYKILAEVARTVDDIDNKLAYLKEVQLIKEQMRMGELEYHFKHALAREAVYNSILLKQRSRLHLDVARSIESVFSARLREFYGMLAYHFSLGEDLDKAEEYLIKAGEEALKSSASSEALHYYQEALSIYLGKHGDSADPEKVANLEKNIALALYNKGHLEEALKYFDKVLAAWGEKRSKTRLRQSLGLIINLVNIIGQLYLPSKKAKKPPPPNMNDFVDLTQKRGTALASVDNYRMFVDSIGLLRRLHKIDISRVTKGASMYLHGCALFAYSGFSFKISKKLLEYPAEYISSGDVRSIMDYKFGELIYGVLSGHWTRQLDYSPPVVEDCMRLGELWTAVSYLYWSGVLRVEQGDFGQAKACEEKLEQIGDLYEHDFARARRYTVSARRYLKCRKLPQALHDAEKGISLSASVGQNLNLLNFTGIKAHIQILLGDLKGADKSLKQGHEIISREKRITPWHISSFVLGRFLFDLRQLEDAQKSRDGAKVRSFRDKARHSKKAAYRISRKFAPNRTEMLRLIGVCDWLSGKYKKALEWFGESVSTGQKLGALPELARTYLEIGKRLQERKSKIDRLNGLRAEDYLEKARQMFVAIGLDKDLDDLPEIEVCGEKK